MKKILVTVFVILFFLAILGLILFSALRPKNAPTPVANVQFPTGTSYSQVMQTSHSQSPTEFITAFYTWYLAQATKDPAFPETDSRSTLLSPWLTQDFITNWDTIADETDGNPVLQSQELPTQWENNIQAKVVTQSAASTTLLVSLGNPAIEVVAHLVQVSGEWKLSRVDLPPQ